MEDCPVCLEPVNSTSFNTLPCKHKVCHTCYPKLRIPICPLCRQPYGDTNHLNIDNPEQTIFIEIEYDFIDFLSPRQRRRQRNRRHLQNRPRPRNFTPLEPISIIHVDDSDLIIQNNVLPTISSISPISPISPTSPIQERRYRKKIPNHKRIKQNQKRRNQISNTFNFLRNQHNFF
jgi:hypothetical protein